MKCAYVAEDNPCGAEATVLWNFPVCKDHRDVVLNPRKLSSALSQSAKINPLSSFPGFCYIVLLPDGFMKIGYSNTEKLLKTRLTTLKRECGAPVIELAVIPGGFVAEHLIHEKFSELREAGNGERFRYSPELATFIADAKEGSWEKWLAG